jgi:ribosomal protein S18 acetylase RimI-like enzyme
MTTRVDHLAFDTNHFGFSIARLAGDQLDDARAAEAVATCKAEGVRCLYFLARSDDDATVRAAEAHGFHLADVRMTYERKPAAGSAPLGPDFVLRSAIPADLPRLRALAAAHHTESRFYADPGFPRDRCDALYANWIDNSTRGLADEIVVIARGADPVGYITWKGHAGEGSIGLISVDAEARGAGVGAALVARAVDLSAAAGHSRITVVTQGRNRASQRCYQRGGFLTGSTELWYHRWF